jgi:chemotaxis protein MotA
MVSTSLKTLKGAIGRFTGVFFDSSPDLKTVMEEVIGYASKARKQGLVSLEQAANEIEYPFLRKALNLAVDGADLQEIRSILELEIQIDEQEGEAEAKVFESAGGFAPTIGIIGAVLGLIQVMKSLANIDEVAHGIAVAFVAAVYGVGSANLFFYLRPPKSRRERIVSFSGRNRSLKVWWASSRD